MNYKEKIIGNILIRLISGWENEKSPENDKHNTELFHKAVEELTALYEQAQRDAVGGFAKWYDQDVFPEKGYARQMAEEYLNQTKEDINPKEGE